MGKKIFGIYLAKLDAPNSEAHARLELPASPWELHDAMDKVQLQENEELYLGIDDYYGTPRTSRRPGRMCWMVAKDF